MKNNYKTYVINGFIGFLFAIIFLILKKKGILNHHFLQNISGLILSIFLLYAIVYFTLKPKRESLKKIMILQKYIPFLVLFLIPVSIANFFFTDFFQEPKEQYFTEKNFLFDSNDPACKTVKYGIFLVDQDTVIRFKKSNKDFETIKTFTKEETKQIKWLDTCIYVRLSNFNTILDVVKIGDFNTEDTRFHTLYITKNYLNKNKVEQYLLAKKIKREN